MATNPCCDIHFTCVSCPIITGPDCVPPNNLLPGQLWYNPCTCTFYFDCPGNEDPANTCETLTPLNYKPGAGIQMSGDCENGHFISVRIEPETGLGFTSEGNLTIDCVDLIDHCQLWSRGNLLFDATQFALDCDVNGVCTVRSIVPEYNELDLDGFYESYGPIPDLGVPISVIVWTKNVTVAGKMAIATHVTGELREAPPIRAVYCDIRLNGAALSSARCIASTGNLHLQASCSVAWVIVAPGDVLSVGVQTDESNVEAAHVSGHYIQYT